MFEYLHFLGLGAEAGRRGGKPVHLSLLPPPPSQQGPVQDWHSSRHSPTQAENNGSLVASALFLRHAEHGIEFPYLSN